MVTKNPNQKVVYQHTQWNHLMLSIEKHSLNFLFWVINSCKAPSLPKISVKAFAFKLLLEKTDILKNYKNFIPLTMLY